jgi:hypothetical protein
MNQTFEHIILKAELSQSRAFGSLYNELLNINESPAISNALVDDVSEILNSILLKYTQLSEFQKDILSRIFLEFNRIRILIDPKRLKSFEHYFNDDEELLLFRESEKGLINIIIHSEDCIAFSYIPNKIDDKRLLYFLDRNSDFETLAYDFFSR